MNKSILLTLLLSLALCLGACGDTDTPAAAPTANAPTFAAPDADEPTARPTDSPEPDKTPEPENNPAPSDEPTAAPVDEPAPTPDDIPAPTPSPDAGPEPTDDNPIQAEPTPEELKSAAIACIDGPVSALYAAVGYPQSSDYAPSCLGPGEDGNLYYDGFTVYTYREGDTETVSYVE